MEWAGTDSGLKMLGISEGSAASAGTANPPDRILPPPLEVSGRPTIKVAEGSMVMGLEPAVGGMGFTQSGPADSIQIPGIG